MTDTIPKIQQEVLMKNVLRGVTGRKQIEAGELSDSEIEEIARRCAEIRTREALIRKGEVANG